MCERDTIKFITHCGKDWVRIKNSTRREPVASSLSAVGLEAAYVLVSVWFLFDCFFKKKKINHEKHYIIKDLSNDRFFITVGEPVK